MYHRWKWVTPFVVALVALISVNVTDAASAQSHVEYHIRLRAQAQARIAVQQARARARRAARERRVAEIEKHRLKVVPLSTQDEERWRSYGGGGKYYRAGSYEARMTSIGYYVRVRKGGRKLTTESFYSLNEAVDRAVQLAKDTNPPSIPGYTPPNMRGRNASLAQDAGLPPAEADNEDDSNFTFDFENDEIAVWRCVEKGRENISISFNKETEDFAVNIGNVKAVDDLETLDDAIRMAESIGRKDSPGSRTAPPLSPEETKSRLDDPVQPRNNLPTKKANVKDKET